MTTYTYIPPTSADDAERRYRSWLETFTLRAGFDPDRFADLAKDASKVVWLPPVTVTEAAHLLGIPGSTRGGKAQKLRRLSASGHLPPAHRSPVSGERWWYPEELVELRATRATEIARGRVRGPDRRPRKKVRSGKKRSGRA